ncbi:hypothetical protein [Streptomyces violaceusniger]|nr:hypothetical protein [Streptomyces violaceusniger]
MRVVMIGPVCPAPAQSTSQVVVAVTVTVYRPSGSRVLGCVSEAQRDPP